MGLISRVSSRTYRKNQLATMKFIFFGIICLAVLCNASSPVCEEGSCPEPSRCVADGICSCYGNHMKTIIESSNGDYIQKCGNLRSTGWKGFWISGGVLCGFLLAFYFIGEMNADKDRRSIVNMKTSQEYLDRKHSAKKKNH